jgi:hypothetical protein
VDRDGDLNSVAYNTDAQRDVLLDIHLVGIQDRLADLVCRGGTVAAACLLRECSCCHLVSGN